MSLLLGLGGMLGAFWYAAVAHDAGTVFGVVHVPALVLLLAGPLCAIMMSYAPEQLTAAARHLVRALRFSPSRSRHALYEDLLRFAQDVRQHKAASALETAEASDHELFRQLGPLCVKQYDAAALEQTAVTATQCLSSSIRRSEAVLTSLARIAPAMGLIGTVLGLIKLLRDLTDFSRLGPSMALALLCTLYGLLLANGVYQPLSRRVHTWGTVVVEEARLLTRALLLLREGRPIADIRALFDAGSAPPLADSAPVVTPSVSGGGP